MAERKTTRKTAGKKKTAARKPASKAKSAAKGTASRKPAKAAKATATRKPAKAASSGKKPAGKLSSADVHMGHVFSLRPRVKTSFRQADFLTARLLLEGETYASIDEAARTVAEKALDMTHEGPSKRDPRR
jgi:hypothetical protein